MREQEFEFIRSLVYEHSRINLGPDKRELVTARLGKRLRACQLTSVGEYCELLRAERSPDELAHLIDAISTNHTFFFRENAHFDFVRSHVVPEFIARSGPRGTLSAWSAACSSGEEPYSLAITLQETLPTGAQWRILATDISHRILDKARAGIYRSDVVEKMSPQMVKTYFQRGIGPQEGNFRVRPAVAAQVDFHHLNLLEGEPPSGAPFDLIFCRNVMIYFDRDTQAELVERLTRKLRPGGYLFVGHSESLTGIKHRLQMVRSAIYRHTGRAA